MSPADLFPASPEAAAENPLRLRTLVLLRWMAITGQVAALAIAHFAFGLRLPLTAAAAAVGTLTVLNLFVRFLAGGSRRLSEGEALGSLLLDISQLAALLALTGGINNPFALLILAPVTIAATALAPRTAVLLGLVALGLVTVVSWLHLPLRDAAGRVLELPPIFQFGSWAAIVIGMLFIGLYSHRVAAESRAMSRALLATQMALAREQKLTDLGGVVAAAAQELGPPLATIKLVSAEMLDEVEDETLAEDLRLIRDQADRCRDILRSMGRAGKDDLFLHAAPIEAVLREAAEPHAARGRDLAFRLEADPPGAPQPEILRRPEIIHGLRNLIQNAVDFAAAQVEIRCRWTPEEIVIAVCDDGPGYPVAVLTRIGEPFVRQRPAEERRARPGYEGMGLGLFIAKTLLERTGARLRFRNAPEGGAMVDLRWSRARIEAAPPAVLGENRPIAP